jgi:hypothetical protein
LLSLYQQDIALKEELANSQLTGDELLKLQQQIADEKGKIKAAREQHLKGDTKKREEDLEHGQQAYTKPG